MTPENLIAKLQQNASRDSVPQVARFYTGSDPETQILGVPIGKIFPLARSYAGMTVDRIGSLLDSDYYEVRMAGVSVMDFKARQRHLPKRDRRALYDLYLDRHDRIDSWDLVDRAAVHVVGEWLVPRDRSVLDELASSHDPNRRRTSIVATQAFLQRGETGDTFRIAGLLTNDSDDHVQKAVGNALREAGKYDEEGLRGFLSQHWLPPPTRSAASRRLVA